MEIECGSSRTTNEVSRKSAIEFVPLGPIVMPSLGPVNVICRIILRQPPRFRISTLLLAVTLMVAIATPFNVISVLVVPRDVEAWMINDNRRRHGCSEEGNEKEGEAISEELFL